MNAKPPPFPRQTIVLCDAAELETYLSWWKQMSGWNERRLARIAAANLRKDLWVALRTDVDVCVFFDPPMQDPDVRRGIVQAAMSGHTCVLVDADPLLPHLPDVHFVGVPQNPKILYLSDMHTPERLENLLDPARMTAHARLFHLAGHRATQDNPP